MSGYIAWPRLTPSSFYWYFTQLCCFATIFLTTLHVNLTLALSKSFLVCLIDSTNIFISDTQTWGIMYKKARFLLSLFETNNWELNSVQFQETRLDETVWKRKFPVILLAIIDNVWLVRNWGVIAWTEMALIYGV